MWRWQRPFTSFYATGKNENKKLAKRWGLLFGWAIFIPFFLNLLNGIFFLFDAAPPPWVGLPLFLPGFLISIAFSYAPIYYAATILGIGLILTALKWGQARRVVRILLLVGLLAILLYPIILPYQPAVAAAEGYELFAPAQPGLLNGAVKRAAMISERRACTYNLSGWSEDDSLYYETECNGKIAQWVYFPGEKAEQIADLPANLIQQVVPEPKAINWVYSSGVYPKEAELPTRTLKIRHHEALLSGDGRYLALIARHIYGPEDVLVLQKMTN